MQTVDRDDVRELLESDGDIAVVEALPEAAYRDGHLPGALHLPPDAVRQRAPELLPDRERTVIVYCASLECGLSGRTAKLLEHMGYGDVREYPGGKSDWREAGRRLEPGDAGPSEAG